MLDYNEFKDGGELEAWPPFGEMSFVKVLEGNPEPAGRFDVGGPETRTMVGVWQCTPGKFEYTYPGDEICTLLAGRIRLTDEDGKVHEYTAGDTFYTRKGEVAVWEVIETMRKIFFVHNADAEQLAA